MLATAIRNAIANRANRAPIKLDASKKRAERTRKLSSAILWTGNSLIDGAPVMLIATYDSNNAKTGNMVQTFILRRDVTPLQAIHSGADSSICGKCPHRGTIESRPNDAGILGLINTGRSCYVNVSKSIQSIYGAYQRGGYPTIDPAVFGAGRKIRIGSYGDPAAVPAAVWRALLSRADARVRTGYTHQWDSGRADIAEYMDLCMASADSVADAARAQSAGWRTFRVAPLGDLPVAGEISCPASAESGHKTTCANCGLCAGAQPDRARPIPSIVIQDHGPQKLRAS